jgi:nucleotide-binding universal stress UspA family protein
MNKILVPIENFSPLSLTAAYFAVEFAKRNPTKILFLVFSPSPETGKTNPVPNSEAWPKPFDELVQKARAEKINIDLFFSNENYLETIPRFAQDHNISEIIIAVPPAQEPGYQALNQQIDVLRSSVTSQLVIVRPKEDRLLKEEGKTNPSRSKTLSEKEGK